MAHPFFDALRYPWSRPEANKLHEVLIKLYKSAPAIQFIYDKCAADPPPLTTTMAPNLIWKEALDNLTALRGLRTLCDEVVKQYGKRDGVRNAVRAIEAALAAADRRVFSDGVPEFDSDLVIDRAPLRKQLRALESDEAPTKVVVVQGGSKSGKSHSRYLFEHIAAESEARVVYVCEGVVGTVEEFIDLLFETLEAPDRAPPRSTSEAAWYRAVCIKLMGAAIRMRRALWLAVDDLGPGPDNGPLLDTKIREFCDQLVVSMANPEFRKRFRLMLIDYPGGPPEGSFPTHWKNVYYIQDCINANDVRQEHVEEALASWAATHGRKIIEQEVTKLAAEVVAKAAAPPGGKPRLQVLNEELRTAITNLRKDAP